MADMHLRGVDAAGWIYEVGNAAATIGTLGNIVDTPKLDRAPTNHSSVHLVPRITTQEANAAHVAGLEAEIARLRAGLAAMRWGHAPKCGHLPGTDALCTCGAAAHNAWIDALLRGESCTG